MATCRGQSKIARGAPFFSSVAMTGGHIPCLDRLRDRTIDLCSIDNVSWDFSGRFRPDAAAEFRVLAETVVSPSRRRSNCSAMLPPQRFVARSNLQISPCPILPPLRGLLSTNRKQSRLASPSSDSAETSFVSDNSIDVFAAEALSERRALPSPNFGSL